MAKTPKTPTLVEEMLEDASTSGADRAADSKAALTRIQQMVTLFKLAEEDVARAEAALRKHKADAWRIQSVDLPELLRETGFTELVLEDGTQVRLVDEIDCSISEARKPEAHKWLREHNYSGVIKTVVAVQFGKDQIAAADALFLEVHQRYGENAEQKEAVHTGTLKALLKELMAGGIAFPMETFGVNPYSLAKLSTKKSR